MAATAILKNRKIAISHKRFDRPLLYLVWWRTVTYLTVLPKSWNFKNPRWPPLWKSLKIAKLTDRHHLTISILPNKTTNIIKHNWNQFLLVAKATALKQQILKFYRQILSTKTSFYIYDRPLTDTKFLFTQKWDVMWKATLTRTKPIHISVT